MLNWRKNVKLTLGNRHTDVTKQYWHVSHIVNSILGDGKYRVTLNPDLAEVDIAAKEFDIAMKIVCAPSRKGFILERLVGKNREKIGEFKKLKPAALAAIRSIIPFDGQPPAETTCWIPIENGRRVPRRLNIGEQWSTSLHRTGWSYALAPLRSLHDPRGIIFDGFLEVTFCWSDGGIVYDKPWVGVIHNPAEFPDWVVNRKASSNYSVFNSANFKNSLPYCKGLFVLSEHLAKEVRQRVQVPVSVLRHPTETPQKTFSFDAFMNNVNRKIVQVGHWLRNPNTLYQLRLKNVAKARLDIGHPWEHEVRHALSSSPNPHELKSVEVIPRLDDDAYDDLLAQNIVFLDLLAASANTVIVECIVRNTPVLVNPLPAVVEYLGNDYPFYFRSLEEAEQKADDVECIRKTYDYLRALPKQRFTQEFMLDSVVHSDVYQAIQAKPAEPAVIFAHARSGSTSLARILDLHPSADVLIEPFHHDRQKWFKHDYLGSVLDAPSLDGVLDEVFYQYTAIKHIICQLPQEMNEQLLKRVGKRLLLYRRNGLQAIVSGMISQQTGIWRGERSAVLNQRLRPLDINAIRDHLRFQRAQVQHYRDFLKKHELPSYELAYEDLYDVQLPLHKKLAKVREIFSVLGLPSPGRSVWKSIQSQLDRGKNKLNASETYRLVPNIRQIDRVLSSPENGFLFDAQSA